MKVTRLFIYTAIFTVMGLIIIVPNSKAQEEEIYSGAAGKMTPEDLIQPVMFSKASEIIPDNMYNIDLVNHLNFGWTPNLHVDGTTAFIPSGYGFDIVDISNPAAPVKLSAVNLFSDIYESIKSGNYLYVCDINHGLHVIDVSDLTNPVITGTYENQYGNTRGLAISGSLIFVVGSNEAGLRVIDVSDPYNPFEIGYLPIEGTARAIEVVGNRAYIAARSGGLKVVDITTPSAPVELGVFYTPVGAWELDVSGNYAYMACNDYGIFSVNISDPANMFAVDSLYLGGLARDIQVVDNYAYVSTYDSSFVIIDISAPGSPVRVSDYEMDWNYYSQVTGNYAYCADMSFGMRILDITNKFSPIEIGKYHTGYALTGLDIEGDYLYAANHYGGMAIFDISDSLNPYETGYYYYYEFNRGGRARDIAVNGNYAYISDLDFGLIIVDVSDKSNPVEVGRSYAFLGADIIVAGNYAYVNQPDYGVKFFDVSVPSTPFEVGSYGILGNTWDLRISGNYLYIADQDYGLRIVDISNPANPVLVGLWGDAGIRDIDLAGNIAYCSSNSGFYVLDITDLSNIFQIGYSVLTSRKLIVEGNYAFLAAGGAGLCILDVSDPTYIYEAGRFDTWGAVYDVQKKGDLIYVSDYQDGFYAFTFDNSNVEMPWTAGIMVTEGANSQSLGFGEHERATDGIDWRLDEVEFPPLPIAGTFDVRFTGEFLGNGTVNDYRPTFQNSIEWTIDIQRAAGGNVTLDWVIYQAFEGSLILQDMFGGSLGINVDMSQSNSFTITNNSINQVKIIYSEISTVDWIIDYPAGWSLMSPGIELVDNTVAAVFPDAISAFAFNGTYQQVTDFQSGIGYWLNLSNPASTTMNGQPIDNQTLSLQAGWSMIGSISYTLPFNSIVQAPNNSIVSLFKFDGSYIQVTDQLQQGEGYWINLSNIADITLSSSNIPKAAASNSMLDDIIKNSRVIPVTVETDIGSKDLLIYLSWNAGHNLIKSVNKFFELPPLPPAGLFDVRINQKSSNGLHSIVLNAGEDVNKTIMLSIPPNNKKLTLKWENSNIEPGQFFLRDGVGGSLFPEIDMGRENSLDLNGKPLSSLKLFYYGGGDIVTDYKLKQNYPNPFNQATKITYMLKNEGDVSLIIYNILGQEIMTLINKKQPMGRYTVKWDGTDNFGKVVAGGIYIYRLQTNDINLTKKMVLLK